MKLAWYLQRVRAMDPTEIRDRTADEARRARWRRSTPAPLSVDGPLGAPAPLPAGWLEVLDAGAVREMANDVALLHDGYARFFGRERPMPTTVDHHLEPWTGLRSPSDVHSFSLDHREESVTGNIKSLWEPSRLQYLHPVAATFAVTREERHAEILAAHLRNWCRTNPFLMGAHWTSGIEVGLRALSLVWIRRLLQGWGPVDDLFAPGSEVAASIGRHVQWLDGFPSRQSSANNHQLAELLGLYSATRGFPALDPGGELAAAARREFIDAVGAQTFDSGVNREMATEYHGLVTELTSAFAIEASLNDERSDALDEHLANMLAADRDWRDHRGVPPRLGDEDDARVLAFSDSGRHWYSRLDSLRSGHLRDAPVDRSFLGALAALAPTSDRPARRGSLVFADAGISILRDERAWCSIDHGPHGFLSTNAHAHADALSLDFRWGGTPILVDPGTYCYHGEPEWRDYFRSTRAHNTLEVEGADQSIMSGPFLWSTAARSHLVDAQPDEITAAHHGYLERFSAVHERKVRLTGTGLEVRDRLHGNAADPIAVRLFWHLHPSATLDQQAATLTVGDLAVHLTLPPELEWETVAGQEKPPHGWFSRAFGQKEPTLVLVGSGRLPVDSVLISKFTVEES